MSTSRQTECEDERRLLPRRKQVVTRWPRRRRRRTRHTMSTIKRWFHFRCKVRVSSSFICKAHPLNKNQVMRPFWMVCCANPECGDNTPLLSETEWFQGNIGRQNHRHHPVQLMPLNVDSVPPNGSASGRGDALASQEDVSKERQVPVDVEGRQGNNEVENTHGLPAARPADVPIEQILQGMNRMNQAEAIIL